MATKGYNERYIQEQARRQAEIDKLAKAGYTTSQAEAHFKKYGFGDMTPMEKNLFRKMKNTESGILDVQNYLQPF